MPRSLTPSARPSVANAARLALRIAAGAATAIAIVALSDHRPPKPLSPFAKTGVRTTEARLSGGFAWAPFGVTRGETGTRTNAAVNALAADVLDTAARNPLPRWQRDAAAAYLLTGAIESARQEIESVPSTARTAAMWNELAVAHYTKLTEGGSAADLLAALVAADSALAIDPSFGEAHFNRALIVERMGLRELALDEWQRFVALDGSTAWAVEAREHIARLTKTPPKFSDELKRLYDRVASDPAVAADLARRYPLDMRRWTETEVLGSWAEAEQKEDAAAAARHLAVARTFARLVAARGDTLLADAVQRIETTDAATRKTLAAAYLSFRDAQHTFRDLKPAGAEPLYAEAAGEFARAGSPVALLARYFRASTAYEQGRVDEALDALQQLLAETPAAYRSCRAQIQWELGLCQWAKTRLGDALDTFGAAETAFTELGEKEFAARICDMRAGVLYTVGDDAAGWKLRSDAWQEIGRSNSTSLQASLSAAAIVAILHRDWPAAASLLRLELDAARQAHSEMMIADGLLRRALVLRRMNDLPAARAEEIEARRHTRLIRDHSIRTQYEQRLQWVEGLLAPSPAAAAGAFTRAIAYNEKSGRRMYVPGLYYERAKAYRAAGDVPHAEADLEAAMRELESHRESLPRGDRRWGVFYAADEIFDEAVDVALSRGDVETAFRDADRGRARSLLDAMTGTAGVPLQKIPPRTAVVEYVATAERLVVFVARAEGVRSAIVPVGRETVTAAVEELRKAIAAREQEAARAASRRLYELLIAPVERLLAPNETLAIVADSELSSVPFSALPGRDGRFVVEEHAIVMAPSASAFLRSLARRVPVSGGPILVVVNGEAEGRERLPEASAEADAIASAYGDAEVLQGRRATPEAFARGARRAALIHFGGHALASTVSAEETFLVLANARGGEERLDVKQIAQMKLERAPVVVLAACSTARGRATPLEGTLSAAHGFLAAGATSVVATLWRVDDAESAVFFKRVHQHLRDGATPADAVRSAQIESIHSSASPFLWAAVQDIGS